MASEHRDGESDHGPEDSGPVASESVSTDTESNGDAAPGDWTTRHLWQIQPIRDVAIIAVMLLLLYLGSLASIVTVPLLLAILLAYLFEPVIGFLRRRLRFSRHWAVVAIIVTAGLTVVLPVSIGATLGIAQGIRLVNQVAGNVIRVEKSLSDASKIEELPEGAWQDLAEWLKGVNDDLGILSVDPTAVGVVEIQADKDSESNHIAADIAFAWLEENFPTFAGGIVRTGAGAINLAISVLGAVGTLAFTGFLTAFFFYFISTGWPKVLDFGGSLVPDRRAGRVFDLVKQMDRVVSGFVRGRLTIAAIQAVVYVIGYFIAGVPAAILLGVLVAVLSMVPYLSMLAIPVTIGLLWLEGHTGLRGSLVWVLAAPTVVYAIGQSLDDYVLTPLIQGDATDLDIPSVLFAVFAGGALMGIYGLLIAIPIAACIKILIREIVLPSFRSWVRGERVDFLPIDS